MKPYKSYHDYLIKQLKDPEEAQEYLNAALEDKDDRIFLLALRNVAEAQGGFSKLARSTKLNRVSLYKMLSPKGNPKWGSVIALLRALGIKFRIEKKQPRRKKKAA